MSDPLIQVEEVASHSSSLSDLKSAALDAAADAIVITDFKANIVWVNSAFERLTGYAKEEAIGQSTRLLKSGEHRPSFYKSMWNTIRAGRKWQGELVNRRKDGTLYAEEMTINPVRDSSGAITYFVAIKRDVSERKRDLERVRMLAEAVDNSSEMIAMTDADLRITLVNRALLRALRYSEEKELLGCGVATIMSPNNPPDLFSDITRETIERGEWRGECLHRRSDGSDYPILLSTAAVKDQAGHVLGTLGIAQDITERKRVEQEILFKTALLEAQAQATIDGILAVDETGKIILSNQQFAKIWEVPLAMIQEGNDKPLLDHVISQIQDPHQFVDRVRHLYNHKEEKSRDEIRLKDGRILDRYSAPLIDSSDKYRGRIWFFRDITESKQAAAKLSASEEQFRQLADNIHEVFFVATLDPVRMAYLSPAFEEIWGRSREESYERPEAWIESVIPEDRKNVGEFFAATSQGVQASISYRIKRPDGSVRWIEARAFPVRDGNGGLIKIVGIAEDITILRQTHEQLKIALEDLKEQAEGATKLAELVDILQSCHSAEEAFKIAGNVLQEILRSTAGGLFITSPSRDVVEMVAGWGEFSGTEKVFGPDDCWALRRGKLHSVKNSGSPLRCAHVDSTFDGGYLCLPLAAQGETLGVLYIEDLSEQSNSDEESRTARRQFLERQASAVAERISLALANLRLREVLRSQSIRDPLTGLFNRRFMEESLERELRRAMRGETPVALLMLDIDHFKRFNDTFGHQAGDAVLRSFGNLLKATTRGQDVACRFGGEEFAFVLSGAPPDAAVKRAELLREEIKQLNVHHGGQLLGAVTVSIGIAMFPENADNAEHLIKMADQALYRAKEEGRDRIVCA
jgi:diguanylate cyclase (GGDEF)-like protein/PAS domain S-box-containing protein